MHKAILLLPITLFKRDPILSGTRKVFPSGMFHFHNPVVNVSILSSCGVAIILEVNLLTG